jgi:type IV pilus assembly protein PilX
VALVVALLLLLVITLVGMAAVRSTIMQQKMASNLYDRQVAFQSSEAALRVAEQLITANPKASYVRDCDPIDGNACLADPFSDVNLPAGSLQDVAKGSASDQFTASSIATGQPQFVVENMGTFEDPSAKGLNQTANSLQYGGSGPGLTHVFFRITARSGNPATIDGRAIVTLQTMVKQ